MSELKAVVQVYVRNEDIAGYGYSSDEVWADTAWESLAEAQNSYPKERYRVVYLDAIPSSPTPKPTLICA